MRRTIVLSSRAREGVLRELEKDYNIILLNENPRLQKPVAAHADMQMLCIDGKMFLCKSTFENNPKLGAFLNKSGKGYTIVARDHESEYPFDVSLNALYIESKRVLFAKESSLDSDVKAYCTDSGICISAVKQGYAHCATLCAKDIVVTADIGIARIAEKFACKTLLISSEGICLDGYDRGFIGGASFYDEDLRCMYFFGDLYSHPDADDIAELLSASNITYKCLDTMPLSDFGGAYLI